jgi:hypothetical protein
MIKYIPAHHIPSYEEHSPISERSHGSHIRSRAKKIQ